jgi:hypothetical protein
MEQMWNYGYQGKLDLNTFQSIQLDKVTDQNLIHGETKKILNSGNAWYRSVQNLLLSYLLSKNVTFKTHKTIVLPVVLNGCEPQSLTLGEKYRLQVLENRMMRGIYEPKRDETLGEMT